MEATSTRPCPHCGGEIKTAAKICKHCKKLIEVAANVSQAAPTPSTKSAGVSDFPATSSPPKSGPRAPSSRKKKVLAAVAVAAILVVGAAVALLSGQRPGKRYKDYQEAWPEVGYIVSSPPDEMDAEDALRNKPINESVMAGKQNLPVRDFLSLLLPALRGLLVDVRQGQLLEVMDGDTLHLVTEPGNGGVKLHVLAVNTGASISSQARERLRAVASVTSPAQNIYYRRMDVVGKVYGVRKFSLRSGDDVEALVIDSGLVCVNWPMMSFKNGLDCWR